MNEPYLCEKCNKELNNTNRIYSKIFEGYLCLDCYQNQYPKLPLPTKPILIERYELKN